MSHAPYIYTDDKYFDLGELGSFPITITALVFTDLTADEIRYHKAAVSIMKAVVHVRVGDVFTDLDVTQKIKNDEDWRSEVANHFFKTLGDPRDRREDDAG